MQLDKMDGLKYNEKMILVPYERWVELLDQEKQKFSDVSVDEKNDEQNKNGGENIDSAVKIEDSIDKEVNDVEVSEKVQSDLIPPGVPSNGKSESKDKKNNTQAGNKRKSQWMSLPLKKKK